FSAARRAPAGAARAGPACAARSPNGSSCGSPATRRIVPSSLKSDGDPAFDLFQPPVCDGALNADRRPEAPREPSIDSSWLAEIIVVERECRFVAPSLPWLMRLVFQRRTLACARGCSSWAEDTAT